MMAGDPDMVLPVLMGSSPCKASELAPVSVLAKHSVAYRLFPRAAQPFPKTASA